MSVKPNRHSDQYAHATSHYTSDARDDYVKRSWERPQFRRLLTKALTFLLEQSTDSEPLQVTDIGAGTGEGYGAVADALREIPAAAPLRYRALDRSDAMLEVARRRLGESTTCSFIQADMVEFDYADAPSNLFLSIGVPFSHLTPAALQHVLTKIMVAVADRSNAAVVILDVLGRYSLEWLPLAGEMRREYTMSFFTDTVEPPTVDMTFYSAEDMKRVIDASCPAALRARIEGVEFWDRSVFVGRHTSTGLYNPSLPRLRPLINEVAGTSQASRFVELLTVPIEKVGVFADHVPANVREELEGHCVAWNETVCAALRGEYAHGVCEALRRVDQGVEGEGVGIGHSLTAVIRVRGEPRG